MDVRKLKMADACAVSGYSKDQMRALLRDLPPFTVDQNPGQNRIFTRVELLAIAIISSMEQKYGIKRGAIKHVLEQLMQTIQAPREIEPLACLVIVIGDRSVFYARINEAVKEGLVVPLAPIFERLDTYLGVKASQKQLEISFGPTSLSSLHSSKAK